MLQGLDPGLLSELLTILEDTDSAADTGGGRADPSWTALASNATEWCRVRPLGSFTRTMAQQAGSPVEYEITMRSRTDVDSRKRLRWGSVDLIVVGAPVNADERGEFILLMARVDRD